MAPNLAGLLAVSLAIAVAACVAIEFAAMLIALKIIVAFARASKQELLGARGKDMWRRNGRLVMCETREGDGGPPGLLPRHLGEAFIG
jgi:hypothetical protein